MGVQPVASEMNTHGGEGTSPRSRRIRRSVTVSWTARLRVARDGVRRSATQQSMTAYDPAMAVERLTVSLESELAIAIREAADADEQNVSAWLADAARRRLANRGLRDIVVAWEHEHGALSSDELAAARALVDG